VKVAGSSPGNQEEGEEERHHVVVCESFPSQGEGQRKTNQACCQQKKWSRDHRPKWWTPWSPGLDEPDTTDFQ
jgi:hypothetical protein